LTLAGAVPGSGVGYARRGGLIGNDAAG